MPGFETIGDDRRDFKTYIESAATDLKKDSLLDGGKKIESAFEALAKGSVLEVDSEKTIQGSQLGRKEAKALFKLTKKFIEAHKDLKVSDSLLSNMNVVKEKYAYELGKKFAKLENQIMDKAEIDFTAGTSHLKEQLGKDLKEHQKELNELKGAYRAKLKKYMAIGASCLAVAFTGLVFTIATAGIGLVVGLPLIAVGIVGSGVTYAKGLISVEDAKHEYRVASELQNARIKALELLNDTEKLTDFCKWHGIEPENVTINQLMCAYPITGVRLAKWPEISREFRELNRSYHFRNSLGVLPNDNRYEDGDSFVKRFQGCGLKDDLPKLHFVRYLADSLRWNSPQKYWMYIHLLDVQKGLQPDSHATLQEEYAALQQTDPRNKWQEFRFRTIGESSSRTQAYRAAIKEYSESEEFAAQMKKDRFDPKVNSELFEDYKQYAYLLKVDQDPYVGDFHLGQLNRLKAKLNLVEND